MHLSIYLGLGSGLKELLFSNSLQKYIYVYRNLNFDAYQIRYFFNVNSCLLKSLGLLSLLK